LEAGSWDALPLPNLSPLTSNLRTRVSPCTLRVCGRKNYRLQDIQLSKTTPGELVPRNLLGGRGTRSPGPPRSLTRGAPMPRSVRSRNRRRNLVLYRRATNSKVTYFSRVAVCDSQRAWGLRAPVEPRGLNGLAVIRVENTGLEPVTSWLQTRRSPS
jgi:hypothetical protein